MVTHKVNQIISIALMVILNTGCSLPNGDINEDEILLYLHIQAYFEGNVRVSLNNEIIFNETVQTNPRLGLVFYTGTDRPAIKELQMSSGEKRLCVWYNERVLADTTFVLQDTTYLGIGWSEIDHAAIFRIQKEPFTYH